MTVARREGALDSAWNQARAYVERMRSSGRSSPEVVDGLRRAGWSDEMIGRLSAAVSPPLLQGGLAMEPQAPAEATTADQPMGKAAQGWVPLSFDGSERLRSPSGEFGLFSTVDGEDAVEKGSLVLAKGSEVQWRVTIGRRSAEEGAVTDSGYVAASIGPPYAAATDGGTWTPTGELRVFAPDGRALLKKRFSACIRHCGLSGDAALAWCTTLRNEQNERDSNKLIVLTLDPPQIAFRVGEPHGRIATVGLAVGQVVVSTEDGLCYRCSVQGKLLNEEEVRQKEREGRAATAIREGDGYTLMRAAEESLEETPLSEMSPDQREAVCQLLHEACRCKISDSTKARAHKALAEIALASGQKAAAVSHLRKALEFDPKAGVKKRLQALERDAAGL